MGNPLEILLGIMSALGGFVDIGEMVFTLQAGAKFQYHLLWVLLLGSIGIIIYGEMCGRIAAVLKKPVFALIREELGFARGLPVLIASNLLNIMTCAAEVGGMAIVLRLLTGGRYLPLVFVCAAAIAALVWLMPFEWLERLFGLMGLALLVYIVAAVRVGPQWGLIAKGFLPHLPSLNTSDTFTYWYYAVGIFSSVFLPYEVYFYSSGIIEDKLKPKDLPVNRLTTGVGFGLGGILVASLISLGATIFLPHGIMPQLLGTAGLAALAPVGKAGLICALIGILFAVGGATVETALSGAYNLTQFFSLPWGKGKKPLKVKAFSASWLAVLAVAALILTTGVDPIDLVEYSVIFAVVVMPFTYFPILDIARSKERMGVHANKPLTNVIAWAYFALLLIVSIAAVPLFFLTHGGKGL